MVAMPASSILLALKLKPVSFYYLSFLPGPSQVGPLPLTLTAMAWWEYGSFSNPGHIHTALSQEDRNTYPLSTQLSSAFPQVFYSFFLRPVFIVAGSIHNKRYLGDACWWQRLSELSSVPPKWMCFWKYNFYQVQLSRTCVHDINFKSMQWWHISKSILAVAMDILYVDACLVISNSFRPYEL